MNKFWYYYLLVASLSGSIMSCISHTKLSYDARLGLNHAHQDRIVELRQSLFAGQLYDDNEKWLLSPYPFETISHIVDMDGNPIHPEKEQGIIPVGTRFRIEKIEFPNTLAIATRMLTSPRFNPWVYLRALANSDWELDHPDDKPLIVLLPRGLNNSAEIEQALNQYFAPKGQVEKWLSKRRPTVRSAIQNKKIVSGMSQDELIASKGLPRRWFSQVSDNQKTMIAWYPDQEAWITNGRVLITKPGRKLPPLNTSKSDDTLNN